MFLKKEISGTVLNDIWNKYNIQADSMCAERLRVYAILRDTMLAEDVREIQWKLIHSKLHSSHAHMLQTLKVNIDNSIGLFLLMSNYKGMNLEVLDTILGILPVRYQENECVLRVKEYLYKESKTSVGKYFIDLEMLTPEGKKAELSNYVYNNKVTLLEFWASWCGPCCREIPDLARLYDLYMDKGLEIVGVSLDVNQANWKKTIDMMNISWPQMSDLKGRHGEVLRYGLRGIPTLFLINQEGIIIAKKIGVNMVYEELEKILK